MNTTHALSRRAFVTASAAAAAGTAVVAAPIAARSRGGGEPNGANLLFKSHFNGLNDTAGSPYVSGAGVYHEYGGNRDSDNNSVWPGMSLSSVESFWRSGGWIQCLTGQPGTPSSVAAAQAFVKHSKVSMVNRDGITRQVARNEVLVDGDTEQIQPTIMPGARGLHTQTPGVYVKQWLKHQDDTYPLFPMGNSKYRVVFEIKTTNNQRIASFIFTNSSGTPFYHMEATNHVSGYQVLWSHSNTTATMIQGNTWFLHEVFLDRANHRVRCAVNGNMVHDVQRTNNIFAPSPQDQNAQWNRIFIGTMYGDVAVRKLVFLDEFEIWDNPPKGAFGGLY